MCLDSPLATAGPCIIESLVNRTINQQTMGCVPLLAVIDADLIELSNENNGTEYHMLLNTRVCTHVYTVEHV